MTTTLEDIVYLQSEAGKAELAEAAKLELHDRSLLLQLTRLRLRLGAREAGAVLEQIGLRERAATEFERASEMLFTREGLEQRRGRPWPAIRRPGLRALPSSPTAVAESGATRLHLHRFHMSRPMIGTRRDSPAPSTTSAFMDSPAVPSFIWRMCSSCRLQPWKGFFSIRAVEPEAAEYSRSVTTNRRSRFWNPGCRQLGDWGEGGAWSDA